MYHEFVPGYGEYGPLSKYSWDGRLTSFMRTVESRRDLAACVKWIFVKVPLLMSASEEEVEDALERAASGRRIEMRQHLSAGDLVAILLAQLPNLEHCSLQISSHPSVPIVGAPGLHAGGVSCLPLRTLNVSLHAAASVSEHGVLFSLDVQSRRIIELSTSLETLNLHMCSGTWSHRPSPSLPNLKTLRITFS